MRWEWLLSRVLWVVALVVAALMFAPVQAQAHAGHDHAIRQVEPTAQRPVDVRVIAVATMPKQAGVAVARTGGKSVSLLPADLPRMPQSCPGGCCHLAGTGCCALWLAPTVAMLVPTPGRPIPNFSATRGAGVTPGALPEPPNTLV
jgi:hypothetical protein